MTTLQEIINVLRYEASKEPQPSMSGTREAYYKGMSNAYNRCIDMLEKYLNQGESNTTTNNNNKKDPNSPSMLL